MKNILPLACIAFVMTLSPILAASGSSDDNNAIVIGGRYHAASHVLSQYPFDKDYSYLLGYEYHDASAYWQLGVGFAPQASSTNAANVDYVVTPQLNLIFKDGVFKGGVGVLVSYLSKKDDTKNALSNSTEDKEWTDFYWQVMLGVGLPVGKITLDAFAYYPFKDFDSFDNFKTKDIEYGAWVGYKF